jgi:hypothetical protein
MRTPERELPADPERDGFPPEDVVVRAHIEAETRARQVLHRQPATVGELLVIAESRERAAEIDDEAADRRRRALCGNVNLRQEESGRRTKEKE